MKDSHAPFDPYFVLEIDRGASEDDVKAAYRARVKACHPDVGGDADEFRQVQLAYELLIDPLTRAAFDADGSMPDEKDKLDRLAEDAVNQVLLSLVEQCPDVGRTDFLDAARQALEAQLGETTKHAVDAHCGAERFRTAAQRLKRGNVGGEATAVGKMMMERAAGLERMAETIEQNAESLKLALKKLKEYGYTFTDQDTFGRTLYGATPIHRYKDGKQTTKGSR